MLQKIALTLFLLVTAAVIALLAIAGTRPATYHVERTTVTSASPATIFPLVNDLNHFHEWSPWQDIDPAVKTTIGGSGVGTGSSYSWVGNKNVGEGRMTITESIPDSHVAMKLEFLKPMQSTCDVHFRIQPEGTGSQVTWSMDGTNNYVAKLMTLFVSMDAMVGKDFDKGLGRLKQLGERESAAAGVPAADSTAAAKP